MKNNTRRAFLVLLLFTATWGSIACSHTEQLRKKETSLRQILFLLRSATAQFTLDHQRPPRSLSELVSGGYIKQIPADPFTSRNDTWRIDKSKDYFEIYSGSDRVGSDQTIYSSW